MDTYLYPGIQGYLSVSKDLDEPEIFLGDFLGQDGSTIISSHQHHGAGAGEHMAGRKADCIPPEDNKIYINRPRDDLF
jgi:hypothetical protein